MKLLPCPFCGGELDRLFGPTSFCQEIECQKCGIIIKVSKFKGTVEMYKMANTRHYPTCETCKHYEGGYCKGKTFYGCRVGEIQPDGCSHHEPREE